MQIHIVESGQNLYGIAQAYAVSMEELIQANEIQDPNNLVVGQSLVIPIVGSFYWVRQGDSIFSIGQRFGVPPQQLSEINQIPMESALPIGLRIYIPPRPKTPAEVNAYIEPLGGEVTSTLIEAAQNRSPYLTYLAPFSYQLNRDGTLQAPPLDNIPAIANENNAGLMMVITNLEEGAFSEEVGAALLTNEAAQNTLLDEIIRIANEVGYEDIHFDFEYLRVEDRERYNLFLQKAATRLREQGLLISTALAPKTRADQPGQWYEAHDYRAHGEIVDFVVLMTYEWGYSGGPPMAVSPIGPVRDVIEYALTEMPAEKIMMGQNLYGYDWTLPFVPGGQYAAAVSPNRAIRIAYEQNVPIQYDTEAQAPFFTYVDDSGAEHEVWFEDARSIQAKIDLIKELGLRGISYWKLGLPFPQNWLLISDQFDIRKF
ncbi:glycoside hydrolase family 18 protein [Evansella cellulosilytica]|uniref:Glycoside hydrolase family 18 n=1 Tax=Evansella cellulosilytica (strain ATCC 21833 / DSM 2522 / FERM P-1141 / JCM 9156 / N-4) TaxID=649639 RepID=E6U1P7_EVAC2|nr:glycoside hydrolase family 18 protein [Evansella cellulosilytica]ADU30410.1 glycoside hydrolase family 18 [Evansella cellulosilytica DSM 2522]